MSRRSTNRRHIINVSSGSNSPKVNWQGFSAREDGLNHTKVLTQNDNLFVKALREIDPRENSKSTNLRETLNKTESNSEMGCPWQECFDDGTGCPYYWNINSNAVTWEMPPEYKIFHNIGSVNSAPLIPPVSNLPSVSNLKLPSLPPTTNRVSKFDIPPANMCASSSSIKSVVSHKLSSHLAKDKSKLEMRRYPRKTSDSEDEKIELITSYGEESESEDESESNSKKRRINDKPVEAPKVPIGSSVIYRIQPEPQVIPKPDPELLDYNLKAPPQVGIQAFVKKFTTALEKSKVKSLETEKPEDEDTTVILNQLRKQAKVLQELGGKVPQDVENLIKPPAEPKVDDIIAEIEQERPPDRPGGLALVAGYGDDSDNENSEEEEETFEKPPIKSLFPILEEDCHIKDKPEEPRPEIPSDFDTKLFKRKRRIALDVLPKTISKVEETPSGNETRLGFGFQQGESSTEGKSKFGQISFVKAETINAPPIEENTNGVEDEPVEGLLEMAELVKEKVQFLIEGKQDVSAEQIMLIQLETLVQAHQSKGLTSKYLENWLKETTTEMNKLEQEAVPNGWFCQWDRSNKRYFYKNEQTGRTQWEYPTGSNKPEDTGGAEAMDICTTPPPPPEEEPRPEPPPPPPPPKDEQPKTPPPPTIRNRSISPPPAPRISTPDVSSDALNSPNPQTNDEPRPPGVDSPENPFNTENTVPADKSLGSELESFYSDIASLDTAGEAAPLAPIEVIDKATTDKLISEVKKKKKKTKIGSGLTLKKKEVSQLVEKWKKVQNDF